MVVKYNIPPPPCQLGSNSERLKQTHVFPAVLAPPEVPFLLLPDDGQRAELQKWLDGNGIEPRQVERYADEETVTTLKHPEKA